MNDQSQAASILLDRDKTVTTVPVRSRCSVCYEFDTRATTAELLIPYRVSINGKVQATADGKPHRLTKTDRKIKLQVDPGSHVALYLNSDVHPDYQCNPVYAVEVGDRDVLVKITEQKGRIGHARPVVGMPAGRAADKPGGRPIDSYQALLTGDIWMAISHLYTVAEAETLMPPDTAPAIRNAVRSIYAGLATPRLQIQFPASDTMPAQMLKVSFAEAENVQANITYCPLLTGVLPRTHPCAYAALLTAARQAGVTDMLVTSCWRPMLGSIVHRAGLGLDVSYLASDGEKIHINRTGLRGKHGTQSENVSALEKMLYEEYEAAKKRAESSLSERAERKAEQKAKIEWDAERDRNEPKLMHELREQLRHHQSISQIFDPWYMAASTQNHCSQNANEQRSQNETIHANHMHITIKEPKIL